MNLFFKSILISFLVIFTLYAQDSTVISVGPGTKYYKVFKPSIPWNITILEVDISNPDVKLRTELARDHLGTGLEKTTSMADRNNEPGKIVLGAINGDYFGISDPTNPYTFLANSMIEEGEFTFGRSHVRSSFGFLNTNKPAVDILNFSGSVITANDSSKNINLLNGQRTNESLILYNSSFKPSTETNSFGTEVRLQKIDQPAIGGTYKFIAVEKVTGVGNMVINNDYILSGHGSSNSFLNTNINVGDTVRLNLSTSPYIGSLVSLVGGGPRLITNGTRPSSFVGVEGFGESHVNTRHPRTAVGLNQDSTKVYFVVVDGRQPALSVGMSCAELADYMISIGCYQGVNLDGGGSSTMVVRGAIKNSPSDGNERSVGNALLAVLDADVNQILDSLELSPKQIIIDSTQSRKINIKGIDNWGYQIQVSPLDINWQIIGINGIIDSLGFFIPYETGSGKIIGTINNLSDTVFVTVVSDLMPVWSFSDAGGNMPSWLSPTASTERGMAYNRNNDNPKIYVVNRPNITILNATTGDAVGTLSTSALTGGTYPINDIEVSEDGKIFAANLTTNASTSAFKIYKWNDENSAPENIISFTGSTARFGDKFTVVGSVDNNTAEIYAAAASSNKVFKWTMSGGSFNQTPLEITLSGLSSTGTSPAVYPKALGNSNFYVNGNSIRPREYTPAGTQIGELPSSVVDSRSNAMRYIKSGDKEYLIVYQYGFPNENAKVFDVTTGLADAVVLETTPSLGDNANTIGTSGDIDYRVYQPGVYIFYVLATNNGIGAYQLINEGQVPVELTSFSAVANGKTVDLTWHTATETNNHGFEIERRINKEWATVGFVSGNGTSTEKSVYSFTDDVSTINASKLKYRLKQIDFDGEFSYSNVVEVNLHPLEFSLSQNFPNPFNPSTKIKFTVPNVSGDVFTELKIYDVLGNEVTVLVSEIKKPGEYEVEWNAAAFNKNISSGIYFYKLIAGSFSDVKKMILIK